MAAAVRRAQTGRGNVARHPSQSSNPPNERDASRGGATGRANTRTSSLRRCAPKSVVDIASTNDDGDPISPHRYKKEDQE
jgi:hypothetical protein